MAHLLTIRLHPSTPPLLVTVLLLLFLARPFRAQYNCQPLERFRDELFNSSDRSWLKKNWQNQNCCEWNGVICNFSIPTQLQLSSYDLSGSIPSIVSDIADLTHIDLSSNSFSGIPAGLRHLLNLQDLNLRSNSLQSGMSPDLYTIPSLVNLTVANNSFDTDFPNPEQENQKLELLDISNNKFRGWPKNLCKLKSLKKLILRNNRIGNGGNLSDTIKDLADCKKLKELDFSNNGFVGSFPTSLNNLSAGLLIFRVRDNSLAGEILPSIQKLRALTTLDMGNTSVSGIIPSSMKDLTNLETLFLDHNILSGGLDEILVSLQNLAVLDISYNKLSGDIPKSLGNCSKLWYLSLRNNSFNGSIPPFLWKMSRLQVLDLSFNDLEGKFPSDVIYNSSKFLLEGNRKLCVDNPNLGLAFCSGSPPPGNGGDNPPGNGGGNPPGNGGGNPPGNGDVAPTGKSRSGLSKAAVAIVVIVVIVFLLLILFWLFYKNKCFIYKNFGALAEDISFLKAPLRVTCSDLQTATKGFSPAYLIGSGGIGSVYRGFLQHAKKEAAVKVLKEDTFGDSKTFLEACYSVKMITHQNLVKMLTSCMNVDIDGNRFKALIYEFIPSGNLEMWLHEEVVSQAMSIKKWNLNLYQRLSMAVDIASVLSHLHCDFETPMVHCNLKPSNILISEDMTAHVTDFGMNKLFKLDMIIRNSAGYIAPECWRGSPVSPMWDVYSFGVVLLEMFTGKRPTDEDFGGTSSLRKYVLQGYPSNIEDIIDPLLLSEETGGKLTERSRECIISIFNTALMCSKEAPGDRFVIQVAREKLEKANSAFLEVGGDGEMQHTIEREGSSMAMLV